MNSSTAVVFSLQAPCPRYAQQLANYVDEGPIDLAPELQAHCRQCSACSGFVEGIQTQKHTLHRWHRGHRLHADPDTLFDRVRQRKRQYLSRDVVSFCRQLLLLESDFEAAFPCEGARPPEGLLAALDSVLIWVQSNEIVPPRLQSGLESLAPLDDAGRLRAPIIDDQERHRIVDVLLDEVTDMDRTAADAHLLRAQKAWIFGDNKQVPVYLEQALQSSRKPALSGIVYLHLAIWHADHGQVDRALGLLARAQRLTPDHIAIPFTIGVYAAATGDPTTAHRHLTLAAQRGTRRDRLRRMLSVPSQLHALSQLGVLSNSAVGPAVRDILGTVSRTLPTESWKDYALPK